MNVRRAPLARLCLMAAPSYAGSVCPNSRRIGPSFSSRTAERYCSALYLRWGGHRMSMTGRYLRVESRIIAGILDAPSTLLDVLYPEPEPMDHRARYLDIDKTWHIIHFLLNNHAWEGSGALFGAVLGGTELTDEDLDYGPARYLTPADVGATAQAIKQVSFNELWSSLDEARIHEADLYSETAPESEAYVRENYQALQAFFLKAATSNEAIILWLA